MLKLKTSVTLAVMLRGRQAGKHQHFRGENEDKKDKENGDGLETRQDTCFTVKQAWRATEVRVPAASQRLTHGC